MSSMGAQPGCPSDPQLGMAEQGSECDLSLPCSDGLHAVCGRLLRATALHVLPDPSERAHLPEEEQVPQRSLRDQ